MEKRRITPRDLLDMRFVGDPRLSKDGFRAAFTVSWIDAAQDAYRTGIWVIPVGGTAHESQITNTDPDASPFHDRSPRWSPDSRSLAFLSTRSGTSQIWLLPLDGGEARPLTRSSDGVSEFCWSPDGRRIAFVAREPRIEDESQHKGCRVITRLRYKADGVGYVDERPRHIWMLDVASGEVSQVTAGEFDESSPAFSPNGGMLAFVSDRHAEREIHSNPDVWVLDTGTRGMRIVSEGSGNCSFPVWSPSGDKIAFYANPEGISAANSRLFVASMNGGCRCVTQSFDRSMGNSLVSDTKYRAAESGPCWAPDGSRIYFTSTDGGRASAYSVSMPGEEIRAEVSIPGFSIANLDVGVGPEGSALMVYTGGTQLNPGDVFAGPVHRRLTALNDSLLSQVQLSEHEPLNYEGDQGWPIQGWVMKPTSFEPRKKYPVVVQIHGGPASTVGEVFHHEYQVMAARGYGVFYMNFRGSKGYGQTFSRAIVGDRGGAEFRDIMAGVDALENLPWVDPARIYVTGGSFGGYETNWIVTQTDRFRAAVAQRSCSNIYSKIGTADNGFYHNVAYMGADLWDGLDFLMSRSPIRYAPQVTTPILIVHSDQDLRLPLEQAEQWYTALKRLGKTEVEFVLFHGEHHDLSRTGKPSNRLERLERIIGWFDRHNP